MLLIRPSKEKQGDEKKGKGSLAYKFDFSSKYTGRCVSMSDCLHYKDSQLHGNLAKSPQKIQA